MMGDVVASIRRELTAVATRERAVKEKAYLKSELEHLGATVPDTRRVARATLKTLDALDHERLWALCDALWAEPVHELRAAAVELLMGAPEHLEAGDLPRVESLLRTAKTWALVDPLAISVAGGIVERFGDGAAARRASGGRASGRGVAAAQDPHQHLDRWARDEDFWIRRSALLALLKPLRHGGGDFARFTRYADSMLEEREFFIRKAIGWVLREISRKRPELVIGFLEPRLARAAGLTVSEAVKHLPDGPRLLAARDAAIGRSKPRR